MQATESKVIDAQMQELGLTAPTGSYTSQIPVRPSRSSSQLNSTRSQLNSTRNTPNSTGSYSSQMPVDSSQVLSEQGKQAKGDLEVLVATGKTKDFLGKPLTFNDLDYMTERDLLKYLRIYQSALAVRVNDTFCKTAIKCYSTFASYVLPNCDKDKLYCDLRNDYILGNELDRWSGWLSLRMGGLMAVATTSLLTFNSCDFTSNSKQLNGTGEHSDKPDCDN